MTKENDLTEQEWKRRYAARIMAVAKWPDKPAMQTAEDAAEFEDMSEYFRNHPEAAADEDMSCWDDGDE